MDDLESYLKAKKKMIVTSVNPQISLLAFEHPEVKLYLKKSNSSDCRWDRCGQGIEANGWVYS